MEEKVEYAFEFLTTEKPTAKSKYAFSIENEMGEKVILNEEFSRKYFHKDITEQAMEFPRNPEPNTAFTHYDDVGKEIRSIDAARLIREVNVEIATNGKLNKKIESGDVELQLLYVKHVYEDNTTQKRRCYKYTFSLKYRLGVEVAEVSEEHIHDITWVREATHGYIRYLKDFDTIIDSALERFYAVPRYHVFTSTGWKNIDGRIVYLTDSGVIGGYANNARSESGLRFDVDYARVGKLETAQQFVDMSLVLKKAEKGRVLLLYTLMSTMTTIFEWAHFPLCFLVALIGTTNSFKTSVAVVFSRIFNVMTQETPSISFISTLGGIEKEMSKLEDALLVVDDYLPADTPAEAKDLARKLKFLCRAYGDRIPKRRMTDYAQKGKGAYPVRGCCLITGELYEGITSSQTRSFVISLSQGDVDTEMLAYYQEDRLLLPSFVAGYLEFVTENMARIIQKIVCAKSEKRTMTGFAVPRFRDMFLQFTIVAEILVEYLGTLGIYENVATWTNAVYALIQEFQETYAEQDVVRTVVDALIETIKEKGVRDVQVLSKDSLQKDIFEDAKHYYIRGEALFHYVDEYFGRQKRHFPLSKEALIRLLKERGLLETWTDEKGKVIASRKLQQSKGNTARFLYVIKEKISELLEK